MMRTSGASDVRKRGIENRVPESAKYSHVQSSLDTGRTAAKVKALTNAQVLKRRDEIFLRISGGDLAELFEEYEKVDDEALADNVRGSTEGGPRVVVYEEESKACYDRPYLLLDVRPAAPDFATCHALQARSMPQRLLMQDKIHPDVYKFKNQNGKLIVVYEDHERLAAAAAHILVHRGFNNVFVLTRGLVGFAEHFPHYVEGDRTALPRPPDSPQRTQRKSNLSSSSSRASHTSAQVIQRATHSRSSSGGFKTGGSQASTARALSMRSGGGTLRSGGASRGRQRRDDDDDDNLTRMSEVSIADSVISRCTTRKTKF